LRVAEDGGSDAGCSILDGGIRGMDRASRSDAGEYFFKFSNPWAEAARLPSFPRAARTGGEGAESAGLRVEG